MTSKFAGIAIHSPLGLILLGLLACAPSPRFYVQYGSQLSESELDRILAENPLAPGENIKAVTLGRGPEVSHHVVQVRDREAPHIHKRHDVTVVMLRGRGYLMLAGKRIELAAGDVVFIPRSVPHYYVNTEAQPTVAFVVYSPPFDGEDTVPVKTP